MNEGFGQTNTGKEKKLAEKLAKVSMKKISRKKFKS
jgi:hypothetical protein